MKTINLTQGEVALVDDDDYEFLNKNKWHFNSGYAVRQIPNGLDKRKQKTILMHRVIIELHGTKGFKDVDHIDRNKLNN